MIALASGEAEYYGLVSIASELLGLKSMCLDFGMKVGIEPLLDVTAGIAIGSRRGLKSKAYRHRVLVGTRTGDGRSVKGREELYLRNAGRFPDEANRRSNHREMP